MKVRKNVSVKPYSRFGIGGEVAYFVEVSDWHSLIDAIRIARKKNVPYYILAGGSNLAFADGRLEILLIRLKETRRIGPKVVQTGQRVRADASVQLWALVQRMIKAGLAGLEKLSGIPGTLGGAIVGNAGAYGVEVSKHLTRVRIYDGSRVRWVAKGECGFMYRHSTFKERPWLVLEAEFQFEQGNPQELKRISEEILVKRSKFKWDMKTPGSYFKNILADHIDKKIVDTLDQSKIIEGKIPSGYLLEQVNAKGYRIGGIAVSDFHANVFINDGTGTYADLVTLITELKRRVKERFNISLEEEVRRVDMTLIHTI